MMFTFCSGDYFATFKCHLPPSTAKLALGLNYVEAKPFIGTHFISGDSWILSILPPEDTHNTNERF